MKWVKTNLKKLTLINSSQYEKLVTPIIRVKITLIILPNLQPKSLDQTNLGEKIKKIPKFILKKVQLTLTFQTRDSGH
jgi:hypothetical protein